MTKWISIQDKLPQLGERVLVIAMDKLKYDDSIDSEIAIYDPEADYDNPWLDEDDNQLSFVTHWKTL